MDCCGPGKTKGPEKDNALSSENDPPREHTHSGGCCGGSGAGMWMHLIVMVIVFAAIWYFSKG